MRRAEQGDVGLGPTDAAKALLSSLLHTIKPLHPKRSPRTVRFESFVLLRGFWTPLHDHSPFSHHSYRLSHTATSTSFPSLNIFLPGSPPSPSLSRHSDLPFLFSCFSFYHLYLSSLSLPISPTCLEKKESRLSIMTKSRTSPSLTCAHKTGARHDARK